jgi:hypothetical protein
MDVTQLLIVAVAVAGAVIVGLLAIVPTVLELPGHRESPDPTMPTPLRPDRPGRGHRGRGRAPDSDHRMAA